MEKVTWSIKAEIKKINREQSNNWKCRKENNGTNITERVKLWKNKRREVWIFRYPGHGGEWHNPNDVKNVEEVKNQTQEKQYVNAKKKYNSEIKEKRIK
jgi:hypothetical protein